MKADFSGYATKAGLKCSDGLTIMPDAFKHQDKVRVPLVWQHDHKDPENVLGHALLENRPDGVYAYCYFNQTPKAQHSKELVEHRDITMMSIWANELVKRSNNVLHGAIREVSLVLSGANPGAVIENVTIRHGDEEMILDDEGIIHTGLEIELDHDSLGEDDTSDTQVEEGSNELEHAEGDEDETVQDVYDAMSDKQKEVVHYMIGQVLTASTDNADDEDDADKTDDDLKQDNLDEDPADNGTNTPEGNTEMKHNVFDQTDKDGETNSNILSHDNVKEIVASAVRLGSMRDAVDAYALQHGITDIDQLFPDAQMVGNVPEWLKRRTEWVDMFLGATSKTPFSRIKTMYADITEDDARAKGYITGTLKKEEFFGVAKRVTTPTTIYKKQKIDRDDMIDITDFDVVSWLKAEMRLMLDEELARAALLGDGRDVASEDKINEGNIRPIVSDHELYTVIINVNLDDAESSVEEVIDNVILHRAKYKGTGRPYFFTTETMIAKFLLIKDTQKRRIYEDLDAVAAAMRVQGVIPVEVMEEYTDIVGIIVNPVDYRFGADKGGQVTMFDDFDIDYNQNKYLIETRASGALAKLKSAMVVKKVAGAAVLVTPTEPDFNEVTGVVTIPTVTGVTYKNAAGDGTIVAGAMAALDVGASITIYAEPSTANYYFNTSEDDMWTFTRTG